MSQRWISQSASFDGIELIHESQNVGTLDEKHLERVMSYIFEVWGSIVNVESISADEEVVHYTYDELGFSG